jgi:hypothetical protein
MDENSKGRAKKRAKTNSESPQSDSLDHISITSGSIPSSLAVGIPKSFCEIVTEAAQSSTRTGSSTNSAIFCLSDISKEWNTYAGMKSKGLHPEKVLIPLHKSYTKLCDLEGSDKAMVDMLQSEEALEVHVATLVKTVEGQARLVERAQNRHNEYMDCDCVNCRPEWMNYDFSDVQEMVNAREPQFELLYMISEMNKESSRTYDFRFSNLTVNPETEMANGDLFKGVEPGRRELGHDDVLSLVFVYFQPVLVVWPKTITISVISRSGFSGVVDLLREQVEKVSSLQDQDVPSGDTDQDTSSLDDDANLSALTEQLKSFAAKQSESFKHAFVGHLRRVLPPSGCAQLTALIHELQLPSQRPEGGITHTLVDRLCCTIGKSNIMRLLRQFNRPPLSPVCTVDFDEHIPDDISATVRMLDCTELSLKLDSRTLISDVKSEIAKITGVPARNLSLYAPDLQQPLENEDALARSGLKDGAVSLTCLVEVHKLAAPVQTLSQVVDFVETGSGLFASKGYLYQILRGILEIGCDCGEYSLRVLRLMSAQADGKRRHEGICNDAASRAVAVAAFSLCNTTLRAPAMDAICSLVNSSVLCYDFFPYHDSNCLDIPIAMKDLGLASEADRIVRQIASVITRPHERRSRSSPDGLLGRLARERGLSDRVIRFGKMLFLWKFSDLPNTSDADSLHLEKNAFIANSGLIEPSALGLILESIWNELEQVEVTNSTCGREANLRKDFVCLADRYIENSFRQHETNTSTITFDRYGVADTSRAWNHLRRGLRVLLQFGDAALLGKFEEGLNSLQMRTGEQSTMHSTALHLLLADIMLDENRSSYAPTTHPFIIRICHSRIAQIPRTAPVFSWCMPKANLTNFTAVTDFLRGKDQQMTVSISASSTYETECMQYRIHQNVANANSQYYQSEHSNVSLKQYSVTLKTTKNTIVLKKTLLYHKHILELHKNVQSELRQIEQLLIQLAA